MLNDKTIQKQQVIYVLFLILVLTFLSLSPALNNDFVNLDDAIYLRDNATIKSLTFAGVKEIFSSFVGGNYHPLTILSFAVEYHFFELNAKVYHLTNLILHLFNVILVFWLIYLLTKDQLTSLIVGLLFGIHPMHVESVVWVTERKDVLFAFFYLWSLIDYVSYLKSEQTKKWLRTRSLIFFALSSFSKAQAVTLPIALLLIDHFQKRKITSSVLIEKIPFFVLSFAFGILTLLAAGSQSAFYYAESYSFLERLFLAFYSLWVYLIKLIVPINLSMVYPFPPRVEGMFPWSVYLAPVMILLLGWIVMRLKSYSRTILFGSLFFLVHVVLMLQLIPTGHGFLADRFSYLAYIGLFLILAKGYSYLQNNTDTKFYLKSISTMILIAFVFSISILTFKRSQAWKNTITLWSDVIKKYPQVPLAYATRGAAYFKEGQGDLALEDYNTAIRLNPGYSDAYYNRGNVYYKKGEYAKALADFNQSLKFNPKFIKAYNNRGNTHFYMKNLQLALSDYNLAIELNPNYVQAFNNRGKLYATRKEYHKAILDFNKAVELDPNFPKAYYRRSLAHAKLKMYQKAMEDALKARSLGYALNPEYLAQLEAKLPALSNTNIK